MYVSFDLIYLDNPGAAFLFYWLLFYFFYFFILFILFYFVSFSFILGYQERRVGIVAIAIANVRGGVWGNQFVNEVKVVRRETERECWRGHLNFHLKHKGKGPNHSQMIIGLAS